LSSSISPSVSPSPSPGWTDYTKGDEASLPTGILNLENSYTEQEVSDVATSDDVRVSQDATGKFAIHQFKNYVVDSVGCTLTCELQSNVAPTISTVYLQIFNRNTPAWETVDTDNTSSENTDITLTAEIADTTNYVDASKVIVCRVYQEAI